MSWNYRLATHLFSYKDMKGLEDKEDLRLFSIIEVYYDKNGEISGYQDTGNPTKDLESIADLWETTLKLSEAIKKPVLDLENWPNEYEGENVFIRKGDPFKYENK
jgi:hypothetical protein